MIGKWNWRFVMKKGPVSLRGHHPKFVLVKDDWVHFERLSEEEIEVHIDRLYI